MLADPDQVSYLDFLKNINLRDLFHLWEAFRIDPRLDKWAHAQRQKEKAKRVSRRNWNPAEECRDRNKPLPAK